VRNVVFTFKGYILEFPYHIAVCYNRRFRQLALLPSSAKNTLLDPSKWINLHGPGIRISSVKWTWCLVFVSAFLCAFAKLRKATISFVMSACPSVRLSTWNNSAPTGRILRKLDIWDFLKNMSRKFKFHSNPTRITGALREDVSTFLTVSG
jgi:hypothetical protein